MKIAVISPNPHHLQDIGRLLEARSHTVVLVSGGKNRMQAVAEQEHPDLLLVEGMCCDPDELEYVEYVTSHHPHAAVILICASQTPEFLINSMRAGVREVLPSPAPADALEAAIRRIASKLAGSSSRAQAQVFAFLPCKGGSGATFIATNLGHQLAQGKTVLLIDLNLQFGDALSFLHDGKPPMTLADLAHDIRRLDASLLAAGTVRISPGYSMLAAPDDPSQELEIKPEHIDAILDLAASQYDFVLLDLARHLDALSIRALDRASRIFPVLQANLPAIRNAAKFLAVCRSLNYPAGKTAMIVNRFERTNDIGLDDIRRSLQGVRLHTVANSYREVRASINQGSPLAEMARSNAAARDLAELAAALNPEHEEPRGLLGRLFRRG
jgi:pilus assembly protein CpaE